MEKHQSKKGEFHTTEDFWDCECNTLYIHPKYQSQCSICFTELQEDVPLDSRMEEIMERIEHSDQSRAIIHRFVEELLKLGFGKDSNVNGADAVDLINDYLPALKRVAQIRGGST